MAEPADMTEQWDDDRPTDAGDSDRPTGIPPKFGHHVVGWGVIVTVFVVVALLAYGFVQWAADVLATVWGSL